MPQISELDISMIRNNMKSKSARQLASMLDISAADIESVLKKLGFECGIVTRQQEMDSKKRQPVKAKPVKNLDKIISRVNPDKAANEYHAKRKKEFEFSWRKFANRVIDYSSMQSVRVDKSTTIFINQGEDAEEAKRLYLQRAEDKRKKTYLIN